MPTTLCSESLIRVSHLDANNSKIFGPAFYKPSEAQCSAEQSEAKLMVGRGKAHVIAKQWLVGATPLPLWSKSMHEDANAKVVFKNNLELEVYAGIF